MGDSSPSVLGATGRRTQLEAEMDFLDPYIAEKVVTRKQADLRAEANESTLRSAVAGGDCPAVHWQLISATRLACDRALRWVSLAWSGTVRAVTANADP